MPPDDPIQQFIAYAAARGIPERFHDLYRREVVAIMLLSGATKLEQLDPIALGAAVRDAEQKLQNRRAVCVAIERYLNKLKQTSAGHDGYESDDDSPDSFDWTNSSAVHKPGGNQHRKYVRVPFNGSVSVDGLPANDRAADISLGGMYIESLRHHDVGTTVTVSFKLPRGQASPLTLLASVVYSDPGIGAGLDFVTVPKEARDAIREYIEEVVQAQR